MRQMLICGVQAYVVIAGGFALAVLSKGGFENDEVLASAMMAPLVVGCAYSMRREVGALRRKWLNEQACASVERALTAIGPEYRVLARQHVSPGHENHLAIGPNGVFVVVTSDDVGRVTASSRRLFVNGHTPWRAALDDCRVDALRVRRRVQNALGRPVPVHGVLCFSRALVAVGQEILGVKIVHAPRLARLVASTVTHEPLAAADIETVVKALTATTHDAPSPAARRPRPRSTGEIRSDGRLALLGRVRQRRPSSSKLGGV